MQLQSGFESRDPFIFCFYSSINVITAPSRPRSWTYSTAHWTRACEPVTVNHEGNHHATVRWLCQSHWEPLLELPGALAVVLRRGIAAPAVMRMWARCAAVRRLPTAAASPEAFRRRALPHCGLDISVCGARSRACDLALCRGQRVVRSPRRMSCSRHGTRHRMACPRSTRACCTVRDTTI